MTIAYAVLGALIGASLGSFASACAYRIPRGISLRGRSVCECGQLIPAWRNIPIFTWLIQRGKGACCGASIPAQVFFTELAGALIGAGAAALFGMWGIAALGCLTLLGAGLAKLYFSRRRSEEG